MVGSTGLGPYVGGELITNFGYSSLAWLLLVATLPAVAGFSWVGRQLDLNT